MTGRRQIVFAMLTLTAMAAGPGLPATAQDKKADSAESESVKTIRARDAVRELAEEAREALKSKGEWPRAKPDYASDKNVKAESDDVIAMLGRRLDRAPAVDGYIKWQLLSFKPDVEAGGARAYKAIVAGLPALTPRPKLPYADQRLISSAEQTAREANKPRLRQVIENYETGVKQVEMLNRPAVAYRDAAIDMLPMTNGARIIIRLQDIETRFKAGDKSFEQAVGKMAREVKAASGGESALPPASAKRIVDSLERLEKLDSPHIETINLMASGQVTIGKLNRVLRWKQKDELVSALTK